MTPSDGAAGVDAGMLLQWARQQRQPFTELVEALARVESPTDVPGSQAPVQALLSDALAEIDYAVGRHAGRRTGGLLLASPRGRVRGAPLQLLVGHTDTVWPLGTLGHMPVREADGCLYGPGTFDMKAGLALIVFALRALQELGGEPPLTPVVLMNSDEEVGSPESGRTIRRLARRATRVFVPEPSRGPGGALKTARKGVGTFEVVLQGKAAHAGLDPEGGASAIAELAHVIAELQALADHGCGTTVNVGVVEGGTRSNVVAARARAEVDVRVASQEEGRRVEDRIRTLAPVNPGVSIQVRGGMTIPPLERTPRNRRLWEIASRAGAALGIELEETMVGGGSDGSVTSLFAATLDGLGAVGAGAHAADEHIAIDPTLDRIALLAMLLMAPVDEVRGGDT